MFLDWVITPHKVSRAGLDWDLGATAASWKLDIIAAVVECHYTISRVLYHRTLYMPRYARNVFTVDQLDFRLLCISMPPVHILFDASIPVVYNMSAPAA